MFYFYHDSLFVLIKYLQFILPFFYFSMAAWKLKFQEFFHWSDWMWLDSINNFIALDFYKYFVITWLLIQRGKGNSQIAHIHIWINTYKYINTDIYMYIYTYIGVSMHAHIQSYVYMHRCTHMWIHVHTPIHTQVLKEKETGNCWS